MIPFSILDLAPVPEGSDAGQALRNSLDLARHAERLGYRRFWLAEHHNIPGVASAATAVAIGYVAGGTSTIRVGAGGIMLPNHAPLVVAEQFGTLESLYPGRIDLGLGRAPGTDPLTTQALRRTLASDEDGFARDVLELMAYFRPAEPGQRIRAVPGEGTEVPIYILGSSLYGAHLAAALGLPYAFASHFAPDHMMEAIAAYRSRFRPSEHFASPYLMLAFNVIAAETDAAAAELFTSVQQAFLNLRRGQPGKLPPPDPGLPARLTSMERGMLERTLACSAVGSPETVRRGLDAFIRGTRCDELIVTAQIFDHAARVRSFEIAAAVRDELVPG
jgi:luciferase family oxidoreductase group 1